MKRTLFISALAIGAYYLLKQMLGKEEHSSPIASRQKHLTNAFSRAKEHALAATE